ncbi:hypothetical protein Taro_042430, partial [Colocasia esculenta]|nr:hypothetical protein [Colocasia esculenta]
TKVRVDEELLFSSRLESRKKIPPLLSCIVEKASATCIATRRTRPVGASRQPSYRDGEASRDIRGVAFLLPLCGADRLHVRHVLGAGRPADVSLEKAMPRSVAIRGRCCAGFLGRFGMEACGLACSRREKLVWSGRNADGSSFYVFFAEVGYYDAYRGYLSSWVPQVLLTSEAYPYSPQAKVKRKFRYRLPVRGRVAAVLGQRLQQCSFFPQLLQPVRGRRTRTKFIIGLMDLNEAFHHSWYQSKEVEMADRRDYGGGGEDSEESTQRMIERIWESITDIRMRMDQQAPVPSAAVPPDAGVPVAPVVPPPRVEVPYVASVPPPPVMAAEEPVMQVENFLRLHPPTYTGGPNPDIAEHWIHEIERVFTTMRYGKGVQQQQSQQPLAGRGGGALQQRVWAYSTPGFSVCDRDNRGCRVLNATLLPVALLLPLCGADRLYVHHVLGAGRPANVSLKKVTLRSGEVLSGFSGAFRRGSLRFGVFSPQEARVEQEKHRGIVVLRVLHGGSTMPTVVTSPVGCPRFSVNQAVSSGLVPVLVLYRRAPYHFTCPPTSSFREDSFPCETRQNPARPRAHQAEEGTHSLPALSPFSYCQAVQSERLPSRMGPDQAHKLSFVYDPQSSPMLSPIGPHHSARSIPSFVATSGSSYLSVQPTSLQLAHYPQSKLDLDSRLHSHAQASPRYPQSLSAQNFQSEFKSMKRELSDFQRQLNPKPSFDVTLPDFHGLRIPPHFQLLVYHKYSGAEDPYIHLKEFLYDSTLTYLFLLSHPITLRVLRVSFHIHLGHLTFFLVLRIPLFLFYPSSLTIEAGARLVSGGRGQRVPLLAASGGGLVAVVVTTFSSRHFQVFLVARACTAVIARLCLVSMGVVGLALGRPVFLVVPASVFSRFRGLVLGCQPLMAPVCAERCFRFMPDFVGFCGSRVWTGNPYWALFARLTPLLPSARGSSSRELGVGWVAEALWRRVVVSSSESERCELFVARIGNLLGSGDPLTREHSWADQSLLPRASNVVQPSAVILTGYIQPPTIVDNRDMIYDLHEQQQIDWAEMKRLIRTLRDQVMVNEDMKPENFLSVLSIVTRGPTITFADSELAPPEARRMPLCVSLTINKVAIDATLVDTEASINVCPLSTLRSRNISERRLHPTPTTIAAYDNSRRACHGVVSLQTELRPLVMTIDVYVLDIDPTFKAILGRPWIEALGAIPSTAHQYLKFPFQGRIVKVKSAATTHTVEAIEKIMPTVWPLKERVKRPEIPWPELIYRVVIIQWIQFFQIFTVPKQLSHGGDRRWGLYQFRHCRGPGLPKPDILRLVTCLELVIVWFLPWRCALSPFPGSGGGVVPMMDGLAIIGTVVGESGMIMGDGLMGGMVRVLYSGDVIVATVGVVVVMVVLEITNNWPTSCSSSKAQATTGGGWWMMGLTGTGGEGDYGFGAGW